MFMYVSLAVFFRLQATSGRPTQNDSEPALKMIPGLNVTDSRLSAVLEILGVNITDSSEIWSALSNITGDEILKEAGKQVLVQLNLITN